MIKHETTVCESVEKELRARVRQQAAVAKLSQYALACADISLLLGRATSIVLKTLSVEFCGVSELSRDGKMFLLRAGAGWKRGCVGKAKVKAETRSQAGYTLLCGDAVVVENFSQEKRFIRPALLKEHEVKSSLSVIIKGKEKPYGVLGAYSSSCRSFSKDDINFLQSIANVLAASIERNRIESELQRSLTELTEIRFALDQSSIVAVTDDQGILTYVNDKFCEISGYSREELIGQDHRIINSSHHPKEFFKELWEMISKGRVWRGEIRNRAKDGSHFWVDTTIVPFSGEKDRRCRYVVIHHDITKCKQAERRLQQQAMLLDIAQDAIIVRDLEDRILFWNKGAERLYGWSESEALGQKGYELLFRGSSTQLKRAERALLKDGVWSGELNQVAKDGRDLLVESRWTLLRDEEGNPRAKLIVNTDATEKKQLQGELLRAARLSLIGEFTAGLAHEIKNPLAGIQGAMDILLQRRESDDDETEVLEDVRYSVKRIDRTVRQLLERARLRPLHLMQASLNEVVERALELARHQVAGSRVNGKSVQINFESPESPIMLPVDSAQIEDAILNLVINGIEAIEENGSVTARIRFSDGQVSKTPEVVIEIEDTGRGIEKENLLRIFDPFFTTREEGTGLGLHAVQRIAQAHGGHVEVFSKPGQGSKFSLYLPASTQTSFFNNNVRL